MAVLLYMIAGPLLLVSVVANLYVKLNMRPGDDSDVDDYYHEFEDQHPAYAKYQKWSKITFTSIVAAVLMLFTATLIRGL
ncbi:hypothetical protein ACFL3G_07770 [Planctomycetota bacterium]